MSKKPKYPASADGPAREMFYQDADGKPQDEAIHDGMLADGDERSVLEATRARLAKDGVGVDVLDKLFAIPDEDDEAPVGVHDQDVLEQADENPEVSDAELKRAFHPELLG